MDECPVLLTEPKALHGLQSCDQSCGVFCAFLYGVCKVCLLLFAFMPIMVAILGDFYALALQCCHLVNNSV